MPQTSRSQYLLSICISVFLAACVEEGGDDIDGSSYREADSGQSIKTERDWIGAWGGPRAPIDSYFATPINERPIRIIVSPTLSGETVRLGFSNTFGSSSVTISTVRLALSKSIKDGKESPTDISPDIQSGTSKLILFSGRSMVTIPATEDIISDPVKFHFEFGDNLAASFYVSGTNTEPTITRHCLGAFISSVQKENSAEDEIESSFSVSNSYNPGCPYLNRLDVLNSEALGTVVVLGDSIAEGTHTAEDGPFDSWPWLLAVRLNAAGIGMGVINMGLAGNTVSSAAKTSTNLSVLLEAAPVRFQRDVVDQTNVHTVIVSLGGNDLRDVDSNPEAIISGLQDIIDQGHSEDLRFLVATIPPGAIDAANPGADDERRRINDWILNHKEIEGSLPFDETLRDPDNVDRMLEKYDADHDEIHPDAAGKRALADAIPLDLL